MRHTDERLIPLHVSAMGTSNVRTAGDHSSGSPAGRSVSSRVIVDIEWRVTFAEASACVLLESGSDPAEVLGQRFWSIFPALVGTVAERKLRDAMRRRTTQSFELFYPHADRWLEIRTRRTPTALTIYFHDVTDLKRAPQASHALDAEAGGAPSVGSTLSHLADFVYAFDHEGQLVYANRPLLDLWRLALNEAIGRTAAELFPDPLGRELHRRVQQVLATGRSVRDEACCPNRRGEPEHHEFSLSPIFAGPDGIEGVAGTTRLVTQRRVAEAASATRARRAEALNAIAGELAFVDEQPAALAAVLERIGRAAELEMYLHHELTAGPERLRLLSSGGLTPEQLATFGAPPFADLPLAPGPTRSAPVLLEQIQSRPREIMGPLHHAGIRACVCLPLQAGDRRLGTLTFATRSRDVITDGEARFMQAAAEFVAATIDRHRALADARAARDLALQASQAKDTFLAALSHELRTPLNPVLLLATNAATNPALPPQTRADFEMIAKNVALEARLIDDLLDLTRITHGKLSLVENTWDLHAILQDAALTVKAELEEKAIVLSLDLQAAPATIRGDAVRLQQVFWNVLKNAVKFTPRGGSISIRSSLLASGAVRVEIADSGIGFTPEEIDHAFESFAQGQHASGGASPFGGLGLGLAITQKIVALHAGRIQLASAGRNQGACVIVDLPLARDVHPDNPAVGSSRSKPDPFGDARCGVRILLVEDHQPTRQALLQLLVHRHYEVIAAGSLTEARAVACRKKFDLVISDIGLPDGSGYELMAALRGEFGLTGIALTGYGSEQDLALARAAGFIAHLTKPVSIQSLEAALVAALPLPRES